MQTTINERMSKIYDLCKAQKDSVEHRVDEEQRIDTETHERCAQEKEMKRVQVCTFLGTVLKRGRRDKYINTDVAPLRVHKQNVRPTILRAISTRIHRSCPGGLVGNLFYSDGWT